MYTPGIYDVEMAADGSIRELCDDLLSNDPTEMLFGMTQLASFEEGMSRGEEHADLFDVMCARAGLDAKSGDVVWGGVIIEGSSAR